MSTMSIVYTELNVESITDLVDDISPYVRARNTAFPAITYQVGTEQYERTSSSVYRALAEVEVTCYARSVMEAETVGAAVRDAILDNHCNYLNTIEREYEEAYDDDSVGVFMFIISYTKNLGA